MGWHQYDDGFWGETPEYEPDPDEEPDPNRPKRSIWDDDQDDNPAKDWQYDEDEDPARMPDQPNRGWFGNNERDETAWAQSARGVSPWSDSAYRNPYAPTGDNPRYVKRGHSDTDHRMPGYERYTRARKKADAAMVQYQKVRHPSRALKRHIRYRLDEAGIRKPLQRRIFSEKGWRW